MNFLEKYRPQALSDLVFADVNQQNDFMFRARAKTANNLLLYGPPGSGKSVALEVLARTLVTPAYEPTDVKVINVSHKTSKSQLCDDIQSTGGFVTLNGLGRAVVILEELDGADKAAQLALKGVLDEMRHHALFLATTNDIKAINAALEDRFTTLAFPHPQISAWEERACQILAGEGLHSITPADAAKILAAYVNGDSARRVLEGIERYVFDARQQAG